jgi:antirestriction protein
MTQEEKPRIYVACLAAYNNGKLHGEWIDCDRDSSDIWDEIKAMLAASPMPDAEEWAIHDFENWEGIQIGECEDIEKLAELAQLLKEHGKPFAHYYQDNGSDTTAEDFQEHYMGQYEDEEDFVHQMWEQDGTIQKLQEINIHTWYIDWAAIARDWFISDFHSVEVGYKETYVFNCH